MSNITIEKGINLLISILNNGEFSSIVDLNHPTKETCKTFALVLNLLENGRIYEVIFHKLKEIYNKGNKDEIAVLEQIYEYKKLLDEEMNIPAILPRDVFRKSN